MKTWMLGLLTLGLAGALGAEPIHLVMVGPPGAGKGTQAKQLSAHYQTPHISTGAILRDNIARESALGLEAKEYVEAGELVPNELIVGMLKLRLAEEKDGFILDGFPRTVDQAGVLDQILLSRGLKLSAVVYVQVPDEVVIFRLTKRGRKDDTPEVVRRRLEVYYRETKPVISHYKKTGLVVEIDGDGTVEEVQNRIRLEIDKL